MFHLSQLIEPGITFTTVDIIDINLPHQDALLISVQISNCMMRKVFIDTMSSINVIFKDAFWRMELKKEIVNSSPQPVYGFK